jgi:hypothetical protein
VTTDSDAATIARLAANHDQVVRWLREAEAERDRYRAALTRIYQEGTGAHVEIAREALSGPSNG